MPVTRFCIEALGGTEIYLVRGLDSWIEKYPLIPASVPEQS